MAPEEEFNYHHKRVLMLCGPPGTGKSTMAKVLAQHCGYRAQEVNASDVRSGVELVDLIKNSLQMNSHFEKDNKESKKPTCLILDEIDGALGGGGSSTDGQARGLKMVADYLTKAIEAAEKINQGKKPQEMANSDEEDKEPEEAKKSHLSFKR